MGPCSSRFLLYVGDGALRPRKRNARRVEGERGGDDVRVPGDAGAEAVLRLGELELRQAEALARGVHLLARRAQVEDGLAHLDRGLLAQVAAAHLHLARQRPLLLEPPLAAEAVERGDRELDADAVRVQEMRVALSDQPLVAEDADRRE